MDHIGHLVPIENWLSGEVVDPDLVGPVAKARAELVAQSEEGVKALWGRLASVIDGWCATSGEALPTYIWPFRTNEAGELSYVIPGQGDVRPNFLKIIQRLLREKYPPLVNYFTSLDINPRVGMLKMLAVLILREAADRNPPGALDVSNLYDQIYAKLRPFADEGLRVQRGRKKGGKKTARSRKIDVAQRNQKILLAAKRSRAAGEQRGAIVNDLAEQHSLDPRSIRRILRDACF